VRVAAIYDMAQIPTLIWAIRRQMARILAVLGDGERGAEPQTLPPAALSAATRGLRARPSRVRAVMTTSQAASLAKRPARRRGSFTSR